MTAESQPKLHLEWLPGRFAVVRFPATATLPDWAMNVVTTPVTHSMLICVTRTEKELSLVLEEASIPSDFMPDAPIQRGFAAMRIVGTLEFELVGVLSRMTTALAQAGISVFVISTYDTDIILVRDAERSRAEAAVSEVAVFG